MRQNSYDKSSLPLCCMHSDIADDTVSTTLEIAAISHTRFYARVWYGTEPGICGAGWPAIIIYARMRIMIYTVYMCIPSLVPRPSRARAGVWHAVCNKKGTLIIPHNNVIIRDYKLAYYPGL